MTKILCAYDVALELLNLLSSMYLVFLLTLLAGGFIEQGNRGTSLWWVKFFPPGRFALEYHFYICLCAVFVCIVCDYVLFKCVTLYFSAKSISFYNLTCIGMLICGPYVLGIPNFGPTLSFLYFFVRLLFCFYSMQK